jgi:hypothetical protein
VSLHGERIGDNRDTKPSWPKKLPNQLSIVDDGKMQVPGL